MTSLLFAAGNWLPDMDLNHDKQIQSLLCYRYTIGQTSASKLKPAVMESRLQRTGVWGTDHPGVRKAAGERLSQNPAYPQSGRDDFHVVPLHSSQSKFGKGGIILGRRGSRPYQRGVLRQSRDCRTPKPGGHGSITREASWSACSPLPHSLELK